MPEKLSNEQKHQRVSCAFTHPWIGLFFVAFCARAVFTSWRELDKPISRPDSLFNLLFYVLIAAVYAPMLMRVFRCFSERFVIAIAAVHMAMAAVAWFVPTWFVPTLFNPVAGLLGRVFLILWIFAFILSLNMPVQAIRNPYIGPENGYTARAKSRLIIMGAVIVALFVIGALLMYFVTLR